LLLLYDQEHIDLKASQQMINQFMGTREEWGKMEAKKWDQFIAWLKQQQLIEGEIKADDLWTNLLLED
jgi:hypothetical protein